MSAQGSAKTAGGRRRAVEAVVARMDEVKPPLSPHGLARAAGIDSDTVTKFLAGERWPQLAKRTAMERALGWPTGTIEAIAAGDAPPGHANGTNGSNGSLRRFGDDLVEFLENAERDMTDTQREIWELELRAYARRRAEEIKRDL